MAKIEMNDSAKAAILNATLEAEVEFIEVVRENALEAAIIGELPKKLVLKEAQYRAIYMAMYSLCERLGLSDFYDEWREEPVSEEEEDESTNPTEQTDET